MTDLESVTHDQFEACLNQRFTIELEEANAIEMELVEVNRLGDLNPDDDKRQPYSLIFRGPTEPVLPQRIYPLANETMGALDVFLVPIGPDEDGMRYEAVFT